MNYEMYIRTYPVGSALLQHWAGADQDALKSAFNKITDCWVWAGDARHFWQFADAVDIAALNTLTNEEAAALLGWSDDDWNF